MESYTVDITLQASNDLLSIYSYIAQELLVPKTAQRQVDSIRNAIKTLSSLPLRNKIVLWEPWQSMGIRQTAKQLRNAVY